MFYIRQMYQGEWAEEMKRAPTVIWRFYLALTDDFNFLISRKISRKDEEHRELSLRSLMQSWKFFFKIRWNLYSQRRKSNSCDTSCRYQDKGVWLP